MNRFLFLTFASALTLRPAPQTKENALRSSPPVLMSPEDHDRLIGQVEYIARELGGTKYINIEITPSGQVEQKIFKFRVRLGSDNEGFAPAASTLLEQIGKIVEPQTPDDPKKSEKHVSSGERFYTISVNPYDGKDETHSSNFTCVAVRGSITCRDPVMGYNGLAKLIH